MDDVKGLPRQIFGSVGLRILSAAMLFSVGVILARWLGPEDLGVYSMILAAVGIASLPVTAGLPILLTRETARAYKSGQHGLLRGLWSFALGLVLTALLLAVVLLAIVEPLLLKNFTHVKFGYIAVGFLIVLLTGLDLLRSSAMQGLGSGVWSQLPDALVRPAVFFTLLFAGTQLVIADRLAYGLWTYSLAAGLSFLFGMILLRRSIAGRVTLSRSEYRIRIWLKSLVSLGAFSGTQTVLGNAAVLMLGWLGSDREVGLYKVALQGLALMIIAQSGVSAILAARFSGSFADGDMHAVKRVSDHALALYVSGSVVFLIAFAIAGKPFVRLFFGDRYEGAVAILTILAVGQFVNAITGPAVDVLMMSGHVRPAVVSGIVGCIVLIGTASTTIAMFGAPGMAMSAALGVAIANVLMAIAVSRAVGFDPTIFGASRRWLNRVRDGQPA